MGAMRKRPARLQKQDNGLAPSVTFMRYPLNAYGYSARYSLKPAGESRSYGHLHCVHLTPNALIGDQLAIIPPMARRFFTKSLCLRAIF
jgi:hypothetical protein